MTARRFAPLATMIALAVCVRAQQLPKVRKQKQEKEPPSQTLPLQKEPPAAVVAETARLTFHVSPLSDKGLLSQQTRDALKALFDANRGAAIVKLRAFVAGTGDLRRVQSIVSEVFTDKKIPLPALTTIRVGGLPMEGAQVEIESISVDKRIVNPNGLAFFPAVRAADAGAAIAGMGSGTDMVQVTCFLSSLDDVAAARAAVSRAFPGAAADFVENERLSTEKSAQCEGIARGNARGAAVVNTPKVVLSGAQMAFHEDDSELRLAFERLEKSLGALGVSSKDVVEFRFYSLTRSVEGKANALRPFPQAVGSVLAVEGLPSVDASMAVEVVVAVK